MLHHEVAHVIGVARGEVNDEVFDPAEEEQLKDLGQRPQLFAEL